MKWILTVSTFLLFGLNAFQYFEGEKKNAVNSRLIEMLDSTVMENIRVNAEFKNQMRGMQFYKTHYDNVTDRIAKIKARGYKPDKLLVDIIYRISYTKRSVNLDSLFELGRLETGYGSNNVPGALGELGWPQMTERRLHAMILYFDGDTTGVRLKDYSDNVTMTDWTFAAYMIARNSRPHTEKYPSWKKTWNTGKQTGMKR